MAARGALVVGVVRIAALCILFGAPAAAQDLDRGEALFDNCSQCHGELGQGNQLFGAPNIAGLDAWYVQAQLEKFRSGARGAHPNDVEGMRMRPMSIALMREGDVESVAAYVGSLPSTSPAPSLTGGDPAKGGQLYQQLCTSCHGAKAEGMEATKGPALHTDDWYQMTQLQKFRSGVRGTNPQDPFGMMMRNFAVTLADEQAMKDVIAYITTLSQ
jgi:cytochrome c oxidase subunit 2